MSVEFEAVVSRVAQLHGVATDEVMREMEFALAAARATTDPAAQQRQHEIFPSGIPDPEKFILALAGELAPKN